MAVEMTNDEWEEVCRRHDALVHQGETELDGQGSDRSTATAQSLLRYAEVESDEADDRGHGVHG
jgi:hypothetical protein